MMFGFGKRTPKPDAATELLKTITSHVQQKMPEICQWYVDRLLRRLEEAGTDHEQVEFALECFEAALQNVPRIVEESMRMQHPEAWGLFRLAYLEPTISGIIKQEAATCTNLLPQRVKILLIQREA